jgi:succinate dehydrogenase / fumarate reductase, cytochrome b subunit
MIILPLFNLATYYNMSNLNKMFSSSLGQKVFMALTGLFLCTFLLVHLIGNFQLLKDDYGYAFNSYTKFMTSNPLIKILSYITYLAILFHAFKGLVLVFKNKSARKNKYQVDGSWATSQWTSRYMGVLGTIILVFIVMHMSDFWFEMKFGEIPTQNYIYYEADGVAKSIIADEEIIKTITPEEQATITYNKVEVYKDLYKIVNTTFKQWWYVLLYVVSMLAISFHLLHGFKSAFQSLGINHPSYNKIIKNVGLAFAILVPLGFAIIPLIIFFS